jgi:hypothetical protein
MLEWALYYARNGVPVFPLREIFWLPDGTPSCTCKKTENNPVNFGTNCKAIGKHPEFVKGVFEHGHNDATTDEAKIRLAWGRFPNAGIGRGTKGEIILDLDGPAGMEALARFQAEDGPYPETLRARSGRLAGGEHVIFKTPPIPGAELISTKSPAPGMDIRANGMSFVVQHPSLHKSGRRYEWINPGTPIADAPPALVARLVALLSPSTGNGEPYQRPVGEGVFKAGSVLASMARLSPRTRRATLDFEAALAAIDPLSTRSMKGRESIDRALWRDMVWSMRAHERDWGDGYALQRCMEWSQQFASWDEAAFFKQYWDFYRVGGPELGKQRIYDLADQLAPGWRERAWAAQGVVRSNNPQAEASRPPIGEGASAGASLPPQGPPPQFPPMPPSSPTPPAQPMIRRPRPVIRIKGGELHNEVYQAEVFVKQAGEPLFARGQMLVRPISEAGANSHGELILSPALVTMTPVHLRDSLTRCIDWQKFDGTLKDWKPVNAPEDVAKVMLSRAGSWTYDVLRGVISTPTLRRDGSLLDRPGYDPTTKMYLQQPVALPWFDPNPTREVALVALKDLRALLSECAFVGEDSEAVALSVLITPGVRSSMETAPLHLANAPKAGTGKSFIFDIAAMIWLGGKCPAVAASADEAETDKRLVASVMRGLPVINLDNVSGELSSDFLCQAVSQSQMQIRPLGSSLDSIVSNTATLFASGNNVVLRGDIVRRTLVCQLDARMADPENRVFKGRPLDAVKANRGHYVACALTIVKAYIAAGRPAQGGRALNGFEDWSSLVRDALMWLGCADAVATMAETKEADPDRELLEAMIVGMREAFPDERPVYRSVSRIVEARLATSGEILREVLAEWTHGGEINTKRLGKWFRRFKEQVVEITDETGAKRGFKIQGKKNNHTKNMDWSVIPI